MNAGRSFTNFWVKPGLNVGRGKDDTLFAKITGRIKFLDKGTMGKFVLVEPVEAK